MSSLVLRGAHLPWLEAKPMDVTIADGCIQSITPAVPTAAADVGNESSTMTAETIDCAGWVLVPGFIDIHTHIREPGKESAETAESASRAAVAGGFTALHAMANTTPVADNPATIDAVWRRGREVGLVDIRPVGAITVGLNGQELAPIAAMHDTDARPVIFSDDGHCVQRADLMRAALQAVRTFDGVVAQHAQEATLTAGAQLNEGEIARKLGMPGWPAVAESLIVARDVMLAADTGARLHVCHVSSAQTVEVLRWAKARGLPVTAEVTPHHLLLTDTLAASGDAVYKVNPPLRTSADVMAVREALADGTIDIVATDHAPHESKDKSCAWSDAAMGMLGLETAFAIVFEVMVASGRMDWRRLIDAMSLAPARIAALNVGLPSVGESADLALIDPTAMWSVEPASLQSLSRNTPFTARAMHSAVAMTIRRGAITFTDATVRTSA